MQIEPKHLEIVKSILHSKPQAFYVFGSRANNTARELSDLDILVKSSISTLELSQLREEFEESNLPFKVDLVVWQEISTSFRNKILKDMTPI
jgi:predicted nucleotidyltransferase